jgi:GcrA cell cycle regulator
MTAIVPSRTIVRRPVGGGWDADKIEDLKVRWEAGETCSQIARAMGGGITRNSVIGKVRRLGLPFRDTATSSSPRVKRQGGARSFPCTKAAPAMRKPRLVEPEPEIIGPIGDFPPRGGCKWTNDDPLTRDAGGKLTFRMCGQPGDPWCGHHRARLSAGTTTRADRLKSDEAQRNTGLMRTGLA